MKEENKTWEMTKELTLLLMYLNRFTDRRTSIDEETNYYAWKGYDFDAINELDEEDLIRQGSHRRKSVYITEAGVKKAQELLKKFMQE